MRSRRRCCAPGAGCRASRGAARCAPGCTRSPPTSASRRSSDGPGGSFRSTTGRRPTLTTLSASRWSSPYGWSRTRTKSWASRMGLPRPEARYEQRESVELAFIAALQLLPPRQRAVLILREVLGFSGAEAAAALDTTPASIYSALQRAHRAVEERLPDRSQQATLRALGDEGLREIVDEYVDAWERGDVGAVVDMLAEEARIAMPPMPTWYGGPRSRRCAFSRPGRSRGTTSGASSPLARTGSLRLAKYMWDGTLGSFVPHRRQRARARRPAGRGDHRLPRTGGLRGASACLPSSHA